VAGAGRGRRDPAGGAAQRASGRAGAGLAGPGGTDRGRGAAGPGGRAGAARAGHRPGRHPGRGALGEGGAAAHYKGGFGYHPLLAFCDNTNEALAGLLRPGNAGSNTAADHRTLLDLALAQIPDPWRCGPILVRCDGSGFSHALTAELAARRLQYSVGWPVSEAVRVAIAALPAAAWQPAIDAAGGIRDGADVAELTGLLDLTGWPAGIRVVVRRERPHPGAQLDAFEHRDAVRHRPRQAEQSATGGSQGFNMTQLALRCGSSAAAAPLWRDQPTASTAVSEPQPAGVQTCRGFRDGAA
jgi:hypothetical protein